MTAVKNGVVGIGQTPFATHLAGQRAAGSRTTTGIWRSVICSYCA
jgi:hypothetical protein